MLFDAFALYFSALLQSQQGTLRESSGNCGMQSQRTGYDFLSTI